MSNYISQIDLGDNVVRDIRDLNEAKTRGALGAKNLNVVPYAQNKSVTLAGITWTLNDDGTVVANGTSTDMSYFDFHNRNADVKNPLFLENGNYIVNGCPDNGSTETYYIVIGVTKNEAYQSLGRAVGEDVEITVDGDDEFEDKARIQIQARIAQAGITVSNLVFKPMIRLATDTDPTYQPYAKTNYQLTEDTNAIKPMLNVLGAKNLLPNTGTSRTTNGVTFTVNSDGSVTANGTATTNANALFVVNHSTVKLKKGTYIFTALTTQGSTSTFDAWTSNWDDGVNYFDRGDGVEFTISSDQSTGYVAIRVYAGQTVSNLTFKPMIRPASIDDDTYVPYAMTNYELTKKVPTLKSTTLSAGSTSVTFTGLPTSGDNLIDFYTSTGINFKAIDTATAGQVTLTFDAQSSAVTVYCEIKEV